MNELFAEVFASMKSNKTRIALTGFSIGWGMFILIVLLGAGNGLLTGMTANFSSSSENIVTLSPGKTSIATKGWKKDRPVDIYTSDMQLLMDSDNMSVYPYIQRLFPGYSKSLRVSSGVQYITVNVDGVSPDWEIVKNMHLTCGRNINITDVDSLRKAIILTEDLTKILFPSIKNPVGQYVTVGEIPFLIVGLSQQNLATSNVRNAYIPISTAMSLYQPDGKLSAIYIQTKHLDSREKNESFVTSVREVFASDRKFSVSDKKAIGIHAPYETSLEVSRLLAAIQAFIWVIGLATLVAGIVGISNIMLICVKERTREIGVRLAMGASQGSVITLILLESVIIALVFGYLGMMVGVGLTQFAAWVLSMTGNSMIFGAPTVSLTVIVVANLIMVFSGLIAGYIPAKKAVTIKLVEALTS